MVTFYCVVTRDAHSSTPLFRRFRTWRSSWVCTKRLSTSRRNRRTKTKFHSVLPASVPFNGKGGDRRHVRITRQRQVLRTSKKGAGREREAKTNALFSAAAFFADSQWEQSTSTNDELRK